MLFRSPEFREAEEKYFEETGIFPIMHTVAIRKDVFDANPWVAQNMMTAFEEAKELSRQRMAGFTVSHYPVPWLYHDGIEANKRLFNGDFWPYGIDANKTTLNAFLQFAWEQGTLHKQLTTDDLFPEEVRHHFKL